jgi:RimJ/RimL family protein N-acetyltransferase
MPTAAPKTFLNELEQPVGFPLPGWKAPARPPRSPMEGRACRLEVLDPARHAGPLFAALAEDRDGRLWTYLPAGPFKDEAGCTAWLSARAADTDRLTYAIVDKAAGAALGAASYLNINPAAGSIEVGSITYSPRLQRTAAATEAMFLMMRRVFDELDYRRYEWKCNALNAASRRAAERLGFTYEGLFRQAAVVKGRNRDTAWLSIIDGEWPVLKQGFERWLDPANFDGAGRQRQSLGALIAQARAASAG